MMIFYVPADRAILSGLARVALRHAHLERVLQMTIKELEGMTIREALETIGRAGPKELRKRIKTLARKRLGKHEAVSKLRELLARTVGATRERNRLLHGVWCIPRDGGEAMVQTSDGKSVPLPSAAKLRELAREIECLTNELLAARFYGYLDAALRRPVSKA